MNIGCHVLKLLFPKSEAERRDYRQLIQQAEAHTEDLQRTIAANGFAVDDTNGSAVDKGLTKDGAQVS